MPGDLSVQRHDRVVAHPVEFQNALAGIRERRAVENVAQALTETLHRHRRVAIDRIRKQGVERGERGQFERGDLHRTRLFGDRARHRIAFARDDVAKCAILLRRAPSFVERGVVVVAGSIGLIRLVSEEFAPFQNPKLVPP